MKAYGWFQSWENVFSTQRILEMAIVDEYESWVEQYAEQGADLGGMILVWLVN